MKKITVFFMFISFLLLVLGCSSKIENQKKNENYYLYYIMQMKDSKQLLSQWKKARREIADKWNGYIRSVEGFNEDFKNMDEDYQNVEFLLKQYHEKEIKWLKNYQTTKEWKENREKFLKDGNAENEERMNYLRSISEKDIGKKPEWNMSLVNNILNTPPDSPKNREIDWSKVHDYVN